MAGDRGGAPAATTVADRVLHDAGLGSEISGVVRRTFLVELEPRHAEAVRHAEELLVDLSLLAGRRSRSEPEEMVAAALTDLALTVCYLDDANDLAPRSPREKAWQRRTAGWLVTLDEILGEMRRALHGGGGRKKGTERGRS